MITTEKIADALGRKEMAQALGVGLTSISNAVVRGSFPASWFFVVTRLAGDAGVSCPPCLFQMKEDRAVGHSRGTPKSIPHFVFPESPGARNA